MAPPADARAARREREYSRFTQVYIRMRYVMRITRERKQAMPACCSAAFVYARCLFQRERERAREWLVYALLCFLSLMRCRGVTLKSTPEVFLRRRCFLR